MARARIDDAEGRAAVAHWRVGDRGTLTRPDLALAVRYLLQILAERARGNAVEVRVPPFGAVQCIDGPGHTRGTPPNVVEMEPDVWLKLATGELSWSSGLAEGSIRASGLRADLSGVLPLP